MPQVHAASGDRLGLGGKESRTSPLPPCTIGLSDIQGIRIQKPLREP